MNKRVLGALGVATLLGVVYTVANPTGVVRTEYTVTTDKITQPYKIVFISDIHYGCVQDKRVVAKALSDVSTECADVIVLGGDIVQYPVTSKTDMLDIFSRLGELHAKDGIYFVYGNHDEADDGTAFDKPKHTDFYTQEDLVEALDSNGINILRDSSVELDDNVTLIGRDDGMSKVRKRLNIASIAQSSTRYTVCIDHTPVELEDCSRAGVDLLLSGHTHGGQLFPINIMEALIWKMPVYGEKRFGHMSAIVSSGMGVGAYALRNVHHCEYVVIDILPR